MDPDSVRGAGRWTVSRRSGRKVYASSAGRRCQGREAAQQSQADAQSALTARAHRRELLDLSAALTRLVDAGAPLASLQGNEQLRFWGVPSRTAARYAEAGVASLFAWQVECLSCADLCALRGGSLVYSAPTSGGKTLVAELLTLRALAVRGGTALFVVPFVALAAEKAEHFRHLWQDLGLCVRCTEEGDGDELPEADVVVCTIEKASALLTRLLRDGQGGRLCVLAADELHMVGDKQRGFLLEVLISKAVFALGPALQIVGMSATLPNLEALSQWTGGALFRTGFRPVALELLVCADQTLHKVLPADASARSAYAVLGAGRVALQAVRRVPRLDLPEDADGFLGLCVESVAAGRSVLLFCPTKDRCEKCCSLLVQALRREAVRAAGGRSASEQARLAGGRADTLRALQRTAVGVCDQLLGCVVAGVAFHHAGLVSDERTVIEDAFRRGFISVLCATSTLSAGVNLPAHRVIVREPRMGGQPLSVSVFRQMAGRAGRQGFSEGGEAILMVRSAADRRLACELLAGSLPPLLSCLHEGAGGGVERLLLDCIVAGVVRCPAHVLALSACTLVSRQLEASVVRARFDAALHFLVLHQFVSEREDGLAATPKGSAASRSGIAPMEVAGVLGALEQARRRFVLRSGLHAVYLCTPPEPRLVTPWAALETVVAKLLLDQPETRDTLALLGVAEEELHRFRTHPPRPDCRHARTLFYRRVFASIVLFDVAQERPVVGVAAFIGSSRGDVQQLQRDAAAHCGMTVALARGLNWTHLAAVLESYQRRLALGVRDELLPLLRMGADMPAFRARAFLASGLRSPLEVGRAGVAAVASVLRDCAPFEERAPVLVVRGSSRLVAEAGAEPMDDDALKFDRLAIRIIARAAQVLRREAQVLHS